VGNIAHLCRLHSSQEILSLFQWKTQVELGLAMFTI
jgi:hypothetical protein